MTDKIVQRYLSGEPIRRLAMEFGVGYGALYKRLTSIAPPARRRGQHHPASLLERFESKYTPEPMSGCWLWVGNQNREGYGSFFWDSCSQNIPAHRASYLLFKGPIQPRWEIDHLCKNRCCVNPEHLRMVTKTENLIGRVNANREKRFCCRGHEFTDENTTIERSGARRCRECARFVKRRSYARRLSLREEKAA